MTTPVDDGVIIAKSRNVLQEKPRRVKLRELSPSVIVRMEGGRVRGKKVDRQMGEGHRSLRKRRRKARKQAAILTGSGICARMAW